MKTIVLAVVLATLILSSNIYGQEKGKDGNLAEAQLKIQIIIGKNVLSATMHNNPATMDFLSLLPLTLMLEDYAKTEKISYLPRKLSVKDAPSGSDPSPGDISYYSPWGNLAIFYRDFGYSNGLIILGKLDSGIDLLRKYEGSIEVRLEK